MEEQKHPKGWEDTVNDLIRANFDYRNTNLALKKKFGDIGAIGGDVYRHMKEKITGGDRVDEKIDELGDRKFRGPKQDTEKKPPVWTKQKQTQADNSKLAQIVNMAVYQGMMPFCENQQLKEEHVQEINPGGAVVASLNYYFPDTNLEHPLVMLGIRVVILYVKFKSVCTRVKELVSTDRVVNLGKKGTESGLKPGMKTEVRK